MEEVLVIFRRRRVKATRRELLKFKRGVEAFAGFLPVNSVVIVCSAGRDLFNKTKQAIRKDLAKRK